MTAASARASGPNSLIVGEALPTALNTATALFCVKPPKQKHPAPALLTRLAAARTSAGVGAMTSLARIATPRSVPIRCTCAAIPVP